MSWCWISCAAFVRAPEPTGAALFAALGLSWDPRWLESRPISRPIRTASTAQVREPLYRGSSGRARHYQAELAELRESLADLLPAVEASDRQ